MNVSCPNCATVYRVDPAKVPEGGVRARCNICSAVFAVGREAVPRATAPEGAASSSSAPAAAPPPPQVPRPPPRHRRRPPMPGPATVAPAPMPVPPRADQPRRVPPAP